jgi:hypothetical protein
MSEKGISLLPSQLEFLSEDEMVTIIPKFAQHALGLLALEVFF